MSLIIQDEPKPPELKASTLTEAQTVKPIQPVKERYLKLHQKHVVESYGGPVVIGKSTLYCEPFTEDNHAEFMCRQLRLNHKSYVLIMGTGIKLTDDKDASGKPVRSILQYYELYVDDQVAKGKKAHKGPKSSAPMSDSDMGFYMPGHSGVCTNARLRTAAKARAKRSANNPAKQNLFKNTQQMEGEV